MRAQKRYSSSSSGNRLREGSYARRHYRRRQSPRRRQAEEERLCERDDREVPGEQEDSEEEVNHGLEYYLGDSDLTHSSDDPDKLPAFVDVDLPVVRANARCPICLEIIKKTRTMTGCMHRFCKECIDKSMRLGKNECPACRKHCASRRSLRVDVRYDAIIAGVYDELAKCEEEEMTFHEEEKTRNRQFQVSISQIFRRQSEAWTTNRKKGEASSSTMRSQQNYWNAHSRRRRNNRATDPEISEDSEDGDNHSENKDSCSSDEWGTEIRRRRQYRRRGRGQRFQHSSSAVKSIGGLDDLEASRENKSTISVPVLNPEIPAWGGGGTRSKCVRNNRTTKLTNYLENVKENDDKLDIHLMLISLDKQRMPSLQKPYLCCPPHFPVEYLKEYVAHETLLRAENIEILLVKEDPPTIGLQSMLDSSTSVENNVMLQTLEGQETLAELRGDYDFGNQLKLAYRLKQRDLHVRHQPTSSFEFRSWP